MTLDPDTSPLHPRPHPRDPQQFESATSRTAHDDAARLEEIAKHGDPSVPGTTAAAAGARRSVEWVRPTDLAARGGARLTEGVLATQERLTEIVRETVRENRTHMRTFLARREAELTPETPATSSQRVLGRTAVSR
ncbi:hypothetical protein ACTJI8_20320 [Microbacterium sp. 22303]|uniref:hypothetical protein n=1 Tax=Microbacterium sp. 22303 TaxID=3453905 RepID=UPI003F82A66D